MGNNIRKLRGKEGLFQEELAEKLGVSRTAVVNLENPNCTCLTPKRAEQIAGIFNCSAVEVFGFGIFKYPVETDEDKIRIIKMLINSLDNKEQVKELWD